MDTSPNMRYNLLVIGSGSGGMAMARRAAFHAKRLGQQLRIGVIERDVENLIGGTCVSRGCVPKKVMWTAATIADTFGHVAEHYGLVNAAKFDFSKRESGKSSWNTGLKSRVKMVIRTLKYAFALHRRGVN